MRFSFCLGPEVRLAWRGCSGGDGRFLSHTQEFATANLKSVGAALFLILPAFLIEANPASWIGPTGFGIVFLAVFYFSLKWFSGALAFAHGFSENRGCLSLFPLALLTLLIILFPAFLLSAAA